MPSFPLSSTLLQAAPRADFPALGPALPPTRIPDEPKKKRTAPGEPETGEGPEPAGGGELRTATGWLAYGSVWRTAEFCCTARRMVPSDTLNARAAARWLVPLASNWRSFPASMITRGRPSSFP